MDVEKFIECVKKYPILYNTRNKDYKNAPKKAEVWEIIAKEKNESSEMLRTKWKGLKDGYTKYKKQMEGSTGSCKAYTNWCWGPHLAFLDNFMKKRKSTSTVSTASQGSPSDSSFRTESPSQQAANTTHVPASPQEDISIEQSEPISSPSPIPKVPIAEPFVPRKSRQQVGRTLNCIRKKRMKTSDAVDDLFSSYAKTFKRFSITTQTTLKVELAKLFADAEIREHNMNDVPMYPIVSIESDSNQYYQD